MLLRAAGWSATRELDDFARVAAGAHAQRRRDGKADRDQVNRSTALWAAMEVDHKVALALAEAEIARPTLAARLSIVPDPRKRTDRTATFADLVLDDHLGRALETYLETEKSGALEVVDVAAAIIRSAQERGGLIPERLAGADLDVALDALSRLGRGTGVYGLSRSVMSVRQGLEERGPVHAADVVRALAGLHKNYNQPHLSAMLDQADAAAGRRAPVDGWLGQARRMYDAAEVLGSKRGIVDGEMVVRALFELDADLRHAIDQHDDLSMWVAGIRPEPARERGTEPSLDVPAPKDLLGRDVLAKAIVGHLDVIGKRGESSLLIHLDGVWGAGKSSVLGFIEKAMHDDYFVVEVNAWREQRVGTQWWTLYRALLDAHLEASGGWWRRLLVRCRFMWDVVRVRGHRLLPVLITLVLVTAGLLIAWQSGVTALQLGIAGVLSVIALGITGFTGLFALLAPASPRRATALIESSSNPMGEVSQLFGRALGRSEKPVVFLIDDLDRCEVEYVIKFLEVVQTLVRDAPRCGATWRGPYAIIAADGGWLRQCYQKTYQDLVPAELPGKPLGHRFLEKLFQMHIRLPTVEDDTKRRYFQSLLFPGESEPEPTVADRSSQADEDDDKVQRLSEQISTSKSTEDLSRLTADIASVADPAQRQNLRSAAVDHLTSTQLHSQRLHELMSFCDLLDPNPRTIRLFVNAVSIQTYLRLLEGVPVNRSKLALWAVLEARWPALADHLREHPDDVVPGEKAGGPSGQLSEELAELLRSEDVDPVLRSRRWGAFDAASVRACTGTAAAVPAH
jgi:hypothetical protein